MHIVLCGDSIFDNEVYVRTGEPAVIEQVRDRLSGADSATLLAVDGDVTANVADQIRKLPKDATHLFVSVGGNDALGHFSFFEESVQMAGEALARLEDIRRGFETAYGAMLEELAQLELAVTACTIYHPRFDGKPLSRLEGMEPVPPNANLLQRMAMGALAAFNDVVTHQTFRAGLPLIDLRLLCDDDEDFANPIEPSARGGDKIAETIVRIAEQHDFSRAGSRVYV